MRCLAIDPGPTQSAFVLFDGVRVIDHDLLTNQALLERLIAREFGGDPYVTVIERIEAMGMSVGESVFETVHWAGRFAQASQPFDRVTRRAVKLHLCGTMRAKDANISQALRDRFGGASAVGRKSAPGPLYGISSHRWAALAVAITWMDQQRLQERSGEHERTIVQ
jgi:hypothetical protein